MKSGGVFDTDVFVFGGGPAGLAAAIAARQLGFRVILADADQPPINKTCGEGLMPDSLTAAAALGIELSSDEGFPFRGIRFAGASATVDGLFPRGAGRGVRRTILHSLLVRAAARAGVTMHWRTSVTGISGHTVRTRSGTLTARWLIGADGGQSIFRRWVGLAEVRREERRFGFRSHYPIAPWSDYVEIHWHDDCQFYVTPVAANEVCVVLMSRDRHLRIADALPKFPALYDKLNGVSAADGEGGALAAVRRLRRVTCGHAGLVGDASGTVDAITGEGLCLAFQQSLALAKALETGDLVLYQKAHAMLSRRPLWMGRLMLLMDGRPWLQRRALQTLASRPELFGKLLAGHVGLLGPGGLAKAAATLGWKIVSR
jgi:flavin-dependent dehydrogenase